MKKKNREFGTKEDANDTLALKCSTLTLYLERR